MQFDMSRIHHDSIAITVVSPSGDQFVIADNQRSRKQSVILLKDGFAGGEGSVDFTVGESVTRYGVRRKGWKVPQLSGSLKVLVTDDEQDLSVAFRRWRAAWSRFEPTKLKVVWRDGQSSEIDVVLDSAAPLPSSFVGLHSMEDEISWTNFSGVWTGSRQVYSGTFTKAFPGELPPSLRLKWDGRATSFTLPSGLKLTLGQGPGERFINLDRGMQGQITDVNGVVDSDTWSSLRGVLVGETLTPHKLYTFQLGAGLELEAIPRYLSPWR
ncbi:hypothetical protein [Corynebacterium sp. HMSC076D02]|uniref:hypothetical protein n=1 Tax=Corynebacterium sp. HMSC076D02 TaxID=1739439 RepID=UPI0008A40A17|nr:hypothetical protein [Corynebacterium sp. HMSC076D02]OFQ49570.1 hypothetical protein HMPREF2935_00545 [Corynebacterium sp. HMSC076D02]